MMDNSLTGRRILVVEDEMMVLMLIEDMLAGLGCDSVSTAATVDQALAVMDGRTFDVAMLDVNLNARTVSGGRRTCGARHPVRLLDRL